MGPSFGFGQFASVFSATFSKPFWVLLPQSAGIYISCFEKKTAKLGDNPTGRQALAN